jgi:L-ascorbate metabolism protein UlaG (beta-lactamase superfamily)
MKLKWLGTAGFQVEAGARTFLIDPYLTRNPKARPVQTLSPDEVAGAGQIFLTHGHFDHIFDIPAIMAKGASSIYCSDMAGETLRLSGVESGRIHAIREDGFAADFGAYKAQAFFSRHVKFDTPLVAKALLRIGSNYRRLAKMHKDYREGQVMSWRFTMDRYTMHHFGSGGSTPEELERIAASPTDLLLVPLQGHSHICEIAFEYVRILQPRMVIPHHQDDFYPPISTYVDIEPFVTAVREKCPGTEVRLMAMNETITMWE